jgi:membrane protein required for beta-lactamase induction
MYLFDIFSGIFYLLLTLVFGSIVLLMCCGPELKNTDLNIMSDNQSPRDIYELNQENQDHDKYN